MLSVLRRRSTAIHGRPPQLFRFRPLLEALEDRITPYVLSGYQWANVNVSVSYMPDGTLISSSYPSNLFAVYNAAYPQATWQREVARALQSWADVSNLNFHFVSDDGAPQGTAGPAQGDSEFGDIRIGGYNMGSGILGIGWNPGSTTTAGDVELNTSSAFPIGSIPDLASVVMHEVGHGIGFNHTLVDPAVMEGGLWGTYPGPYADDIAGVQAMYGARRPDAYDAAASNNTLATATALTLSGGAVNINADITTMADVDYYKVTAPASSDGTLTVLVDARNLSLFDPKITVLNSSGTQLATASASSYGDMATVSLTGLVAGQTYYLEVSGATTDPFGMGAYKLSAQLGPVPLPSLTINNVSMAEGNSGTTPFKFYVTVSSPSLKPITVQYATADGTATTANNDYQAASGTLTFAPGQTQQTVTVLVNGDTVPEPNETFFVNLSSPTNAVLGTSQGTGTIQNDDIGPDRYEVDDTMPTAHNFGTMSSLNETGLTLHSSSDLDYYEFSPSAKSTYVVTLTATQGSGTLSLTAMDTSGTTLATSQSTNGVVTLNVSLSAGKMYCLKVSSPTSSLFMYNLSLTKSGSGGHHLVVQGALNPDDQAAGDVFYQNAADDPDYAGDVPPNPVSPAPLLPASDAALATGTRVSGALPGAARPFQNPAVSRPVLAGALLNLGHQPAAILSAKVAAPAAVLPGPDRGSSAVVVQGVPRPRVESRGGAVLADEEPGQFSAERSAPQAGTPVDGATKDEDSTQLLQRACDACFADGSWPTELVSPAIPLRETVLRPSSRVEPASPAPKAVTAVVAVAVVLGGYGGALRVETEPRRQRR
jgi:hypothetical protein